MLRYYESVSFTASGTVGGYVFSANGLFDPNITGTGHQPMGFDQMMLSYEHYCVTKARLVLMAQNSITTGSANVAVQIAPSNTLQTLSQQIVENGTVVLEKLNAGPQYGSVQQIRQAVVIGKYQGIVNVIDNPDNLGTVAANPVEQEYFHIYGWTDDGTTGTVYLNVCIEYEAVFIEPKKLTQSLRDAMHQLNTAEAKTKPAKGATGWDSDPEIQLVECPSSETQETKDGEKVLRTPSGKLFALARHGKPDMIFRSEEEVRKYLLSAPKTHAS